MAQANKAKTAMDDVIVNGSFKRTEATCRSWIKADGSTPYKPEPNRYHIYVSYACPWASRTLAVRALKGLEGVIGVTVVHPVMFRTRPDDPADDHTGWFLGTSTPEDAKAYPECEPDPSTFGFKNIRDIYEHCSAAGRYSVPVLWDIKTSVIVNNESSEIIRMLNSEFNELAKNPGLDLYPAELRGQIDDFNDWILTGYNNGVYRSGFATKQGPYEEGVRDVFNALDKLEDILSRSRYLCGNTFTEADIRLFVTLVRHDEVYHGHFKCNKKRIADYPNLENYTRDVYQIPGMAGTVNMKHIKDHYHKSHPTINKYGIVPVGPGVDYSLPHDRDRLGARK